MQPNSTNQLDFRRYLRILWRRKLVFVATLLVVPTAAYFISSRNPKVYQSSVIMQVQATAVDTSLINDTPQAVTPAAAQISIAARLIETTGVAQEAARHLSAPPSASALLGAIDVKPDVDTGFITLTASAPQPQRAADIATAFARAIVTVRTQQAVDRLNQAINEAQIALTGLKDKIARRQLSAQLQRFRALKAAQGNNATVIEPATANPTAVSPKPGRAVRLSLFVALLLGIGAVALVEAFDRRVREPEELEDITGLPLLSTVPREAFSNGSRAADEAFHTLRASLMFFNVDRTLKSIMVTSPQQADGKTTVAVNLARAFSRGGRDVILLDADLRRPNVARRMEVEIQHGIGSILVGESTLDDVMLEEPVSVSAGSGRLRIVPAGTPPPNPSELTGSHAMRDLIHRLEGMCDLLIIDTNPVLTVSDAIPIMEQVSGVLLVCRVDQTTRDGITRLRTIIEGGKGVALGIVATGAQAGGMYGYGYGYGYREEPNGNGNGESNGNGNGDRRRRRFGRRKKEAQLEPGAVEPDRS